MAYIAKLPNELMLDVFENFDTTPSDILKVMQCCRAWHRLAIPILYRNIVLETDFRGTSRFASGFHSNNTHFVQSFTVRLTECSSTSLSASYTSVDALNYLLDFCDLLKSIPQLRTFSLSIKQPAEHGTLFPSHAIVSILSHLPATVVNLHLDCDRLSAPILNQEHACFALSKIVPGLETLQLRLSHICSGLFSGLSDHAYLDRDTQRHVPKATSKLRELTMRVDLGVDSPHGLKTCRCFSGDEPLGSARLARSIQNLYEWGAFPSMRQFVVESRDAAISLRRDEKWRVCCTTSSSKEGAPKSLNEGLAIEWIKGRSEVER